MTKGVFVVFEGVDGSGKSTQLKMLREFLAAKKIPCQITREPGGTVVGERIRELLLDPSFTDINERTEALLYAAARAQLVSRFIRPCLDQGEVVLCDRYIDSTLAYQGYGRGMDIQFLKQINQMATGDLLPQLTILLDLPPEEGLARTRKVRANDRLENEALEFHQRVRSGYLALAEKSPNLYLTLDARQPLERIHDSICQAIGGLIGV